MATPTTERGGIIQAIRALRAGGWELAYVNDGEDDITVTNEREAVEAIMAVDEATLAVRHNSDTKLGWVYFVLGNAPYEVINDYTINLEELDTLTSEWM